MEKKPSRIKPNETDLKKRAKEGLYRKLSYLIQQKGTIEFIAPEDHHWYRMLAHHKPLEKVDQQGKFCTTGTLGNVKYYYIPQTEMKALNALFSEYKIPASLHHVITWCYLNMVFASCIALASDQYNLNFTRSTREIHSLFQVLDDLLQKKCTLKAADLFIETIEEDGKAQKTKSKKVKLTASVPVGFLEDLLAIYKQLPIYETLNQFYSVQKEPGHIKTNMGHKNSEKYAQYYYATALYNHLEKTLFHFDLQLIYEPEKLKKEVNRLKRLYPERKIYLFIGRLMQLSGLLKEKADSTDEMLIDLIKKKLFPKKLPKAFVEK